jgi:hypothetical protein
MKRAPRRSAAARSASLDACAYTRERQARVGVTETGLSGLEIGAVEHERGRVGAAQVVEREP